MKMKYITFIVGIFLVLLYAKSILLHHKQTHTLDTMSECLLCDRMNHLNLILSDTSILAQEKTFNQKIDEAKEKRTKDRKRKREKFFCTFDIFKIKKFITQHTSIKFKALGFDATAPPMKIL